MILPVQIVNHTLPAVSVTPSGGVTYQQFLNSLGQYDYRIRNIFLQSTSINQISLVFQFDIYDVNGTQGIKSIVPAVDPFQKQASLLVNDSMLLNGNSNVATNILPNTSLEITLSGDVINNSANSNTNFKALEQIFDKQGFFGLSCQPESFDKYIKETTMEEKEIAKTDCTCNCNIFLYLAAAGVLYVLLSKKES